LKHWSVVLLAEGCDRKEEIKAVGGERRREHILSPRNFRILRERKPTRQNMLI
jgi:hypothetical protein